MKQIAVFINIHTIYQLRFSEARILCDNGNYGEIDTIRGFIRMTMYSGTYKPAFTFDENMHILNHLPSVTRTTTDQAMDITHVNMVGNYLSDNESFNLKFFLIDTDVVKLSEEMSYFLSNPKSNPHDEPTRFTFAISGESGAVEAGGNGTGS